MPKERGEGHGCPCLGARPESGWLEGHKASGEWLPPGCPTFLSCDLGQQLTTEHPADTGRLSRCSVSINSLPPHTAPQVAVHAALSGRIRKLRRREAGWLAPGAQLVCQKWDWNGKAWQPAPTLHRLSEHGTSPTQVGWGGFPPKALRVTVLGPSCQAVSSQALSFLSISAQILLGRQSLDLGPVGIKDDLT